ncbi:zf-HC2 domain-containing protein [Acetivibrio cellulolyticus]|uniref:zf-HC2 domain-containing protein n=1 Tax=Acetivibrio cellulolyticus TaxID=35830 RepID=UPI0001E2BE82|nr:zf-HC2 domain-containing protein [Acetivibrio cellulolyticus]
MNCEETLELLEEYIIGELDLEKRQLVEKHLQDCSDCNTEYMETEEVIRGLHNLKNSKIASGDILNMSKMVGERKKWEMPIPSVAAAVFFVMFLLTSSVIAFPTFASTFAPGLPVVKQLLETQKDYNTAMQENQEIKILNEKIEQENQQLKKNIKEIGGFSIVEYQTSQSIGEDDNDKVQNLVINFIKAQYKGDIEKIKAMCTEEFKVQVDRMKDSILMDSKGDFVFTQITNISKEGDSYFVSVRLNDTSDIPDYELDFELKKINDKFYVSFEGKDV